jgi:hypothetical protein
MRRRRSAGSGRKKKGWKFPIVCSTFSSVCFRTGPEYSFSAWFFHPLGLCLFRPKPIVRTWRGMSLSLRLLNKQANVKWIEGTLVYSVEWLWMAQRFISCPNPHRTDMYILCSNTTYNYNTSHHQLNYSGIGSVSSCCIRRARNVNRIAKSAMQFPSDFTALNIQDVLRSTIHHFQFDLRI